MANLDFREVSQKKATTWVLETQTKGTGATMVPLERYQKKPGAPIPGFKLPKLKEPELGEPEARGPLRFRLVDVLSRELLADDVDARGAVAVLEGARSIVDFTAYVWDSETQRWRLLTLAETRALWELRGDAAMAASAKV